MQVSLLNVSVTWCTRLLYNDTINKGDKMVFSNDIVARRLKKFREKANLTQEQLAEKANLSRNGISNIECEKNKFSYNSLIDVCDALDICPCELISGVEHKTIDLNIIDLLKHTDEEGKQFFYFLLLEYNEYKKLK